jgi:hypothetical protein
MNRYLLAGLVAASALVVLPSAAAKEFRPGDLRVCNARHCVAIVKGGVLERIGAFYYGRYGLTPVRRPALRVPYYELRFRNGYATGIVATARLDRFLSYGVNSGRFAARRWYSVPLGVSAELRRLTRGLRPLRLSRAALERST